MFFKTIKLLFHFIFGNTVARFAYDRRMFKSRWYSKPWSDGWTWLTRCFITQKIIGYNRNVPWPCTSSMLVVKPENIIFHPDDLNNFVTTGCYFQAIGKIIIGKGTFIAPNVGIITQNHDLEDPDKRGVAKDVVFGEKCWIGMNSMILPGVHLGPHTVVGAGSVVTKSFEEGYCVIAGNPAKVIKKITQ